MLRLYRETMFGEITNPALNDIKDINFIEAVTLVPLVIATLLFGVAPWLIMDITAGSAQRVLSLFAGGS